MISGSLHLIGPAGLTEALLYRAEVGFKPVDFGHADDRRTKFNNSLLFKRIPVSGLVDVLVLEEVFIITMP